MNANLSPTLYISYAFKLESFRTFRDLVVTPLSEEDKGGRSVINCLAFRRDFGSFLWTKVGASLEMLKSSKGRRKNLAFPKSTFLRYMDEAEIHSRVGRLNKALSNFSKVGLSIFTNCSNFNTE